MLLHVNHAYLIFCLSIANQDVQTTASMAQGVILNVQSTVKIVIATYKTELALHADKDGKETLVKQVQI